MRKIILFLCVCCLVGVAYAQEPFRVMFYNVENLFDCQHDTLKNDYEFLPDAPKGWTRARYNDKLAKIAKVIVATGVKDVPDLVGLCEVENDHCMKDLTEYWHCFISVEALNCLAKTPFVFRTKRLTGRLPVTFFM